MYFETLLTQLNFTDKHIGRKNPSGGYTLSTGKNSFWVKAEYLKNTEKNINEHLCTPKSLSMSYWNKFDYCEGFMLEWDDHKNLESFDKRKEIQKTILNILGPPRYAENSIKDKGFHFYYNCENIHKDKLNLFKNTINTKYSLDIDIKTFNVRLPMSYKYEPIKTRLNTTPLSKDNIEKFISINENVNKKVNKFKKIKIYERENSSNSNNSNKENFLKNIEDIKIYAGHRHLSCMTICYKNRVYGEPFTEIEIRDIILEKNVDSKDIAKFGSNWLLKDITNKMSHARSTTEIKHNKILVNNQLEKYVPSEVPEKFFKIAKYEAKKVLYNMDIKKTNKKKRTLEVLQTVIEQIYGKMLYNEQNPRKIGNNIYLTHSKKEELLVGIQFDYNTLLKMKKHYGWKNIDMRKIYNSISLSLFKQYKHNDLGYSYGRYSFCRQFILKINISSYSLIHNIIYNFKLLYNIFKNNINIIITNNIILYIMLEVFYTKNGLNLEINKDFNLLFD